MIHDEIQREKKEKLPLLVVKQTIFLHPSIHSDHTHTHTNTNTNDVFRD